MVTVAEAERLGLSWERLQWRDWKRVGHGQYVRLPSEPGPELRLLAVHRRLPEGAAFGAATAAWLHGLDLPPCDPIDVVAPLACRISARAGTRLRRAQLDRDEIVERMGLPVTRIERTISDLALLVSLTDAVVAVDEALHKGLTDLTALWQSVASSAHRRGVGRLRRVLRVAEPRTESPMESRLRVLLILAGLPRPDAQVEIRDEAGMFIARVDFLYPRARLVIEYDGSTHRDTLVDDSRRQNRLIQAGYRLLRFTSSDLRAPTAVVDQVRIALSKKPDLPANRSLRGPARA